MNSMSKGCCQDEKEKKAKVLLKCKPSSTKIVTVLAGADEQSTPLANVSLNTRHFSDSCIQFEFSTNLVAAGVGETVSLSFQLYKLCKGETVAKTIGNPWLYSISADLADIITFIVCDFDYDCDCDKNDCCSYSVSATTSEPPASEPVSATTLAVPAHIVPTNDPSTLTFNNPILSALVVEKQSHSC